MDELLVDKRYRELLFAYLDEEPNNTGTEFKPNWKLECPLCGAKKSTLVWMPDRQTYKFFCSKPNRCVCGHPCEFPVLLKIWNQPLWMAYLVEREESGTAGAGWNVPKVSLMNLSPCPRKQRLRFNRKAPRQHKTDGKPGAGRTCWCPFWRVDKFLGNISGVWILR